MSNHARETVELVELLDCIDRKLQSISTQIEDGLAQDLEDALLQMSGTGMVPQNLGGLKLLRHALVEAKQLAFGLGVAELEDQQIVPAFRRMIDQCQAGARLHIEFDFSGDFRDVRSDVSGQLLRIAQQALHNCLRHSHSRNARVRLRKGDDYVQLEVRDWGVGFAAAEVGHNRYGLWSMHIRASLVQGSMVLNSEPGQGTRILVRVPIQSV